MLKELQCSVRVDEENGRVEIGEIRSRYPWSVMRGQKKGV